MSSVDQSLHAFADLFCQYHDSLDERLVRENWHRWERDAGWGSTKLAVFHDVLNGRGTFSTVMRVDNSGDRRDLVTLAALRGMDEAFRFVNPTLQGVERTPVALLRLQKFVEVRGRLSSHTVDGALIPAVARRGDPDLGVEHLRELFTYVQRVPASSWDLADRVLVAPGDRLSVGEVRDGLHIACVPVVGDPAEMRMETRERHGRRVYQIRPRDLAVTLDRIDEIVANLRASGAQIAIAPEATLSGAILERWQQALATAPGSRLRYVVAGSGLVAIDAGAQNDAVLLDGRSGRVVGRQAKLFRFDMDAETLRRWRLVPWLGEEPVAEDLAVEERRLTVFELGAVRLAILVCEDVNRPVDLGPLVRDLGVSLLAVPVFSRPVRKHRWEHAAGALHVRETGAAVIVSNSLIVASVLGETEPGTSMLIAPNGEGALVGKSGGPAAVTSFRVRQDGSAVPR